MAIQIFSSAGNSVAKGTQILIIMPLILDTETMTVLISTSTAESGVFTKTGPGKLTTAFCAARLPETAGKDAQNSKAVPLWLLPN